MYLTDSYEVSSQMANLLAVCWILLIPIGVLLAIILYKIVFLLHTALEFFTLARFEAYPMLQDLRATAHHVEKLSGKVVAGVEAAEQAAQAAVPVVKQGASSVGQQVRGLVDGVGAMLGGLYRVFSGR
ncbi:MAG: hypothetical protein SFZ03_09615 [Candidatus Melainabacteria bacterium]|nr:hypothetical protein [Candidatus Melainabacteria bacterium]